MIQAKFSLEESHIQFLAQCNRPCVIVTNNTYNVRVPVIQVVPFTAWSARKVRIITNMEMVPSLRNGLTKKVGGGLLAGTSY